MSRNIVLLSDGTGNSAAKAHRTNVWHLYRALDLSGPDQIAFYDDGVGTETFLPLKLLGGALGIGLTRNVKELYGFLCRNWREGDRIYMFGFSRGAFTVRLLAGLVLHQGLRKGDSEETYRRAVNRAYRSYRDARYHRGIARDLGLVRDSVLEASPSAPEIEFIGVWDTVGAYGMPIDEMVDLINYLFYPLRLPDLRLSPKVKKARHALALDDERQTFHPTLWDESEVGDRDRIRQVWFAGAHANVGGGYPKNELALISLNWMMDEAASGEHGLLFIPSERDRIRDQAYAHGKLYDARAGLGAYYRYGPRDLRKLCCDRRGHTLIGRPIIHRSVLDRVAEGVVPYAPLAIPPEYDVVPALNEDEAAVLEDKEAAGKRIEALERAWDTVLWRQILYYAILVVTLLLVGTRFFLHWEPGVPSSCEGVGCLLDPLLTGAMWVLPSFASAWIEALRQNTGWLWGLALSFLALMLLKKHLHGRTEALAEAAWRPFRLEATRRTKTDAPTRGTKLRASLTQRIRSNAGTLKLHRLLARNVALSVVLAGMTLFAVLLVSRLIFDVRTTGGWVCRPALSPAPVNDSARFLFRTDAGCHATALILEEGVRYRFDVEVAQKWTDGPLAASPAGLSAAAGHVILAPSLPARRSWAHPWFQLMGRIGHKGKTRFSIGTGPTVVEAQREGQIFTFVNDAVCGMCPGTYATWPYRWPLGPNGGSAWITVTRLGP